MSRALTHSLLILVMILWGLNVVAVKFLVEYFPPILMQGARVFIAAIAVFIVLFFIRDLRKLNKKEWIYILIASLLGQLFHHGFLAVGLTETTASNSSIILGLIPLTTAILAMFFLNERLTFLKIIGIILGLSGVSIVIIYNNGGMGLVSKGDLFVFIAMVSQASSFIVIKKATISLSAKQMTAVMLLVGSLLLLSVSFILEPKGSTNLSVVPMGVWAVLISSAILATGLGHILYNLAINQIGAGQTAIFNNLIPFFALIGSFLLLGETIQMSQLVGFLLIVIGVLLGTGYVDFILSKHDKKTKSLQN
ncbi:EamA family transporter [Aquibacillus halophilus]|uniref:EamA family transporter n=1 Tax=Aquibacillus halophilus TaxID=930132 RepID=A0A6A8DAD1_9BACI|nr:DMT family transporter [Aquibacillus halophilus]MRH42558.1 EamA family transporter [Aquibacillus halophilus]